MDLFAKFKIFTTCRVLFQSFLRKNNVVIEPDIISQQLESKTEVQNRLVISNSCNLICFEFLYSGFLCWKTIMNFMSCVKPPCKFNLQLLCMRFYIDLLSCKSFALIEINILMPACSEYLSVLLNMITISTWCLSLWVLDFQLVFLFVLLKIRNLISPVQSIL